MRKEENKMADKNKIKYGICNVYFSEIDTYDAKEGYTYKAPVKFPGAVSMSLSATGSNNPFYADNIVYTTSETNTGYEGDFEVAKVIDAFKKDILGVVFNETTKQWFESADAVSKEFALGFEFDGDVSKTRYWLYRCKAEKPDIASQTKEETADPQTETLALTIMPRENDHQVLTWAEPDGTNYATWFESVKQPVTQNGDNTQNGGN